MMKTKAQTWIGCAREQVDKIYVYVKTYRHKLFKTLKHLMRLNNRHPRKFKMKIMLFINMEVISVEYWIMWLRNKLLMKILDSALENIGRACT